MNEAQIKITVACAENCPGCLMTFSPDVSLCPLHVFDDWRVGVELDEEEAEILESRRGSEA